MGGKRERFERKSNFREIRPVFVIATEGKKTEPDYFNMRIFKPPETAVKVKMLPTKASSSPIAVLKRMKKYIRDNDIKERDEVWLVVDKDNWKVQHLEALYEWSKSSSYTNLAVSNPQFEYWLLLHFEDGNDVNTKAECLNRLECHCPNYDKSNLDVNKFTSVNVKSAIGRAKLKDNPRCEKWPVTTGTTVYRIVERIIH